MPGRAFCPYSVCRREDGADVAQQVDLSEFESSIKQIPGVLGCAVLRGSDGRPAEIQVFTQTGIDRDAIQSRVMDEVAELDTGDVRRPDRRTEGPRRASSAAPPDRRDGDGGAAAAIGSCRRMGPLYDDPRRWFGRAAAEVAPVPRPLLVLGPIVLPEYKDPNAGRPDVLSAALSLCAVLSVIYGLKQIAQDGLGSLPALSIVAGVAAFSLRCVSPSGPLSMMTRAR